MNSDDVKKEMVLESAYLCGPIVPSTLYTRNKTYRFMNKVLSFFEVYSPTFIDTDSVRNTKKKRNRSVLTRTKFLEDDTVT